MTLQAQHTNGVSADARPDLENEGDARPDALDIEDEMTTLDGFIRALAIVRRDDGLVTLPKDEASWHQWGRTFHALGTIIDATVDQAEKLSRLIHGTSEDEGEDGEKGAA